jgi:hypothetical protein
MAWKTINFPRGLYATIGKTRNFCESGKKSRDEQALLAKKRSRCEAQGYLLFTSLDRIAST